MLPYAAMHTHILPYQENSADLFVHFAHLPYAIFLDSCLPQQNQGRYSIIVAQPIKIIDDHSENIFLEIQNALTTLNCNPAENKFDLPFTIGAMGYLSYDFARQLEKIPAIAVDDIQLPTAIIGIYDWSIVIDHVEKKTVFTSLHANTHPRIKTVLALLNKKPAPQKKFALIKKFQSNMTQHDYNAAFHAIKKNIIAGNCYQVNLAQRFSAEFRGSSWHAYQLLRTHNPAPFAAFMQLPSASILCLSPERFLKVTGDIVETKPIKGTSPRFNDAMQDQLSATNLLQSEKDRAENVMIVDLLRNDLSRVCTAGSVHVPALCALESFSNVHHLVSTITGKLSLEKNIFNLLTDCFPGGSITGAPKIAAMKIIESVEPHRRSLYCGSIFYASVSGSMDSNIAIRTVICDDNKLHCYAGGGIVFDSDCEAEYQETLVKVGKIISTLENAPTAVPAEAH